MEIRNLIGSFGERIMLKTPEETKIHGKKCDFFL